MSKAPVKQLKIVVPAGKATPSPPVGPALGARGVKAMDFCKEFNARTAHLSPSVPTPTSITISPDRTFTFTLRTPPTTYLIKKAAGIEKGSGTPGTLGAFFGGNPPAGGKAGVGGGVGSGSRAGTISLKHVYEIARVKCGDEHLGYLGMERVAKGVLGTARTLGVAVVP